MIFQPCTYRVSAKASIVSDRGLLLVREHNYWDLPGGGVEHFETPHQALERELQEELGVRLHSVDKDPSTTWTLYDPEYRWPLLFIIYSATLHEHPNTEYGQFFTSTQIEKLHLAPYLENYRQHISNLVHSAL